MSEVLVIGGPESGKILALPPHHSTVTFAQRENAPAAFIREDSPGFYFDSNFKTLNLPIERMMWGRKELRIAVHPDMTPETAAHVLLERAHGLLLKELKNEQRYGRRF